VSAQTVELVAWVCTALMGALALSQAIGRTPQVTLFVLQATTWIALAPSAPVAITAAVTGRWLLALVNIVILAALAVLTAPLLRRDAVTTTRPSDPLATIVFANTYYENERPDDTVAALLDLDADLLALAEYTPAIEASLGAKGAFERYPFQVGAAEVTRDGIVLLSRLPITAGAHRDIGDVPGIDATVDVDGVPLRVVVVHPVAPTRARDLRSWTRDLRTYRVLLDEAAASGEAVLVVGDFNAARGHPDFRALVDATPFRSAHEWLGEGWSTSWPINGITPAFVRIDHALVHGVIPTGVTDVDPPGTDHRAFALRFAVPRRS